MANVKITALTSLAANETASADVLPVVDVSADATKKLAISDLHRSVPDGTLSAPGIAFQSDLNSGLYRSGTDAIALVTNGAARILVDATGNVTIPNDLTVQGATTFITGQTVLIEDKNIELGVVSTPTDVTADGGGITLKGTTDKTIKWIDSTNAWTFNNMISVQTSVSGSVYAELKTDGNALGLSANLTAGSSASDSVALNFKTSNSGSETTKMRIDPDGKVGIGTEEPDGTLHVHTGTAGTVTPNSGADDLVVENSGDCGISLLTADGNNTTALMFGCPTQSVGAAIRYNNSTHEMSLGPDDPDSSTSLRINTGDGVEAMRILSNKNVGIGTAAPSVNLHVAGTEPQVYIQDSNSTGNNVNATIQFRDSSNAQQGYLGFASTGNTDLYLTNAASSGGLQLGTGNTTRLTITSTGNAEFGGQVSADSASGAFQASRSDGTGNHVFRGGTSTNNYTSLITAAGSATFAGAITSSSLSAQTSATSSWFQTGTSISGANYVWAAKNSSSGVWHSGLQTDGDLYLGGDLTSDANIGLQGSTGAAFFTSYVTSNEGFYVSQTDTPAGNSIFKSWKGSDTYVDILDNGSAKFAGDNVTIANGTSGEGKLEIYRPGPTEKDAFVVGRTTSDVTATIKNNGNMGLGTDSPVHLLQLQKTMSSSPYFLDLHVVGSNTVGGGGGISFDTSATDTSSDKYRATIAGVRNSNDNGSNDLVFSTTHGDTSIAPIEKMRITSDGNVKFEYTDSSTSISTQIPPGLRIYNKDNTNGRLAGIHFSHGGAGTANAGIFHVTTNTATGSTTCLGDLAFYTKANGSSTMTERMRVESSGTLLVGGTSTADNDHANINANGTLTIRRTNASDDAIVVKEGSTSSFLVEADGFVANFNVGSSAFTAYDNEAGVSGPYAAMGAASGEARITAGSTASDDVPLIFRTSDGGTESDRMKINANGESRIFSSSGTSTIQLHNGSSSGTTNRLLYGLHSSTNVTDGTAIYSIFTNGTVGTPSDIRLKKNVETTRDGYLADLASLRVVKYHWKTQEDSEPKELGLIAQEVEEVFPGLIHTEGEGDDEVKEIKRSVIPYMLLKALQEANAKIESLETRIAALES